MNFFLLLLVMICYDLVVMRLGLICFCFFVYYYCIWPALATGVTRCRDERSSSAELDFPCGFGYGVHILGA